MNDHPDIEQLPLHIDGIPVRESIRELFRNPENGTPDNINRAGCLVLAKASNELGADEGKGHVLWNAWREAFPTRTRSALTSWDNIADFRNQDFQNERINFSEFNFGDGANFEAFHFEYEVKFIKAQFGYRANFHGAQFTDYAEFNIAQFGDLTCFDDTTFEASANFSMVQMGELVSFKRATFKGKAHFSAGQWEGMKCYFYNLEEFEAFKKNAEAHGLSPETFQRIDFSGAIFKGTADFSDRQFKAKTSFGKTVFNAAPLFHGCELHQDTSFEGADFRKAKGGEEAMRAYRTLKLAFNKQQATREEQRFFALELTEERKLLWPRHFRWWVLVAYWLLSNYGFSVVRPLLLWLALAVISSGLYAEPKTEICFIFTPSCTWDSAVLGQSLLQSMPSAGLKTDIPYGFWVSLGIVLHKIFSFGALFLVGLALRNLLKMK